MYLPKAENTKIWILALFVLFLLAGNGLAASSGENRALIIGAGKYDDFPQLSSPPKDAEALARILREKFGYNKENIVVFTDNTPNQPTRQAILKQLDSLLKALSSKDKLLVFFSGHGTTNPQGESFWIPRDGKRNAPDTWLAHSFLVSQYFGSPNLRAASVCILTDTPFSQKLLESKPNLLSLDDLRYGEKLIQKSAKASREVIASSAGNVAGDASTGGLGIFAYYIHKALLENALPVMDFESLLFQKGLLGSLEKKTHKSLIRGRISTSPDEGGQFTIARPDMAALSKPPEPAPKPAAPPAPVAPVVTPKPPVNAPPEFKPQRPQEKPLPPVSAPGVKNKPVPDIASVLARPATVAQNLPFVIEVKTKVAAERAWVEIQGQKRAMEGKGTLWKYTASIPDPGSFPFNVYAENADGVPGRPGTGTITIRENQPEKATLLSVAANPKKVSQGDPCIFTAKTDKACKSVTLVLDGQELNMTSDSGRVWTLTKKFDKLGVVSFSAYAVGTDGTKSNEVQGAALVTAPIVEILESFLEPGIIRPGGELVVIATTNKPAQGVDVQIGGQTYAMKGSGTQWRYEMRVPDDVEDRLTILLKAKNQEGRYGRAVIWEIKK